MVDDTREPLTDMFGRDFEVGDEVIRAITNGGHLAGLSHTVVTRIDDAAGLMYLAHSKVPVWCPERLLNLTASQVESTADMPICVCMPPGGRDGS